MTLEDFTLRLSSWLGFLANALVCMAAVVAYRKHARRSVLCIAVGAGLGAMVSVVSWMVEMAIPRFWDALNLVIALDLVLWAAGTCMLLSETGNRPPDDH
jgi:hypothetical protein